MSKYISKETIIFTNGGEYPLSKLHGSTIMALLREGFKCVPVGKDRVQFSYVNYHSTIGDLINSLGIKPDEVWRHSEFRAKLAAGEEVKIMLTELAAMIEEDHEWLVDITPLVNTFIVKAKKDG
jgi:hypothetical protein